MNFEFYTPSRVIFGQGTIGKLAELAAENGRKPLVLAGSGKVDITRVLGLLDSIPQRYILSHIVGEPSVTDVQAIIDLAIREKCDYIIGFGGGSVLDSGKAVAAMLTNPGSIMDYLEGVGGGRTIEHPSAPYIAIPTTSGTGSEVTKNAVLAVPEKRIKVSMRSPLMIPRAALIDPLLTCSVPPEITASTGMDALTQVIEPYVSSKRNEMTDITSFEGIKRAARSLKKAYIHGGDISAREDMSFASLMGGMSLANAGLGMVHGFAGVIGGMFRAPHGAVCACLLPAVVEINIKALNERKKEDEALKRYEDIARLLTGKETSGHADAWEFLGQLKYDLKIPTLREMGVLQSNFSEILPLAVSASSAKGNPVQLTAGEMKAILEMSF